MKTKQLNRWNGRMNPTGTDGHRIAKVVRNAALALGIATLNWLGTAPAGAAEPGTFAISAASEGAKDGKLSLGLNSPANISAPSKPQGAAFGWFTDLMSAAKAADKKGDPATEVIQKPAGLAEALSKQVLKAGTSAAGAASQKSSASGTAGARQPAKTDRQPRWQEVEAQIRKMVDLATGWCRPGSARWQGSSSTAKN